MARIQRLIGLVASIAPLSVCFACAVETGDASESLGVSEQGIQGTWDGTFSGGEDGDNPQGAPDGSKFCQAYDSRDGRFHPGKLWTTSCRYEYGGGVTKKTSGYYVLQGSYSFVSAPTPPANAVQGYDSGSGGLYLCLTNATNSPGKFWAGKCRYEYSDEAHVTTLFRWVTSP